MTSLRLPRYLNEPERFLLWTVDEVIIVLIPLLLGLFLEKSGMGLIGGLLSFFLYSRLKQKSDNFFSCTGMVLLAVAVPDSGFTPMAAVLGQGGNRIMDNRLWQLLKKVKHRETVWLWGIIGGLVFTTTLLALSVFALKHHVRVVMVPLTFGESLWVDDKTASSRYVEEMAFFLSELYLNETRETRATRLTVLLRHSAPESQGALKALFAKREQEEKGSHDMAVQFSPTNLRVNGLTALIEGELRTFWGQREVMRKRITYQLTFRYTQGRLLLLTFTERDDKAR